MTARPVFVRKGSGFVKGKVDRWRKYWEVVRRVRCVRSRVMLGETLAGPVFA